MEQPERFDEEDLTVNGVYRLKLFIAGASPNSTRAVNNIKNICETYLKDNYELEIIDIHQQPLTAQHEQIIALPLLVKSSPSPLRRMIGDMSDTKKVLTGLGFHKDQM
ncbi:circadian clock protein KaiB [Mucilaginibacter hurinus]|uniref:Circadian clock protein KaiB n=1 Tax=Mucilaginibacter hurinus TaxID=2201324 RepID=A0A367GM59_9SPHI|nr:circadian clock KaiB family protein [Mucilaginibacter hurinus]RCH54125.1 circadian clock protein KaiB [Mucilaginibacter hurinus]